MPLSSDTKNVFRYVLAIHFGVTEEVTEEENGREEGEGGEEIDESVDPTPYLSSVITPEGWYYDPDADYVVIPTEEYLEYVDYKLAVADAERSVCRLRFLLLQKS